MYVGVIRIVQLDPPASASGAGGVITTDLFIYINYALDCVIHMVMEGPTRRARLV